MPPKEKKKISQKKKKVTESAQKKKITEDKMMRIRKAKEQRDIDDFYNRANVEPEEETLEQKIRRNKKELSDNTKK